LARPGLCRAARKSVNLIGTSMRCAAGIGLPS
jgi:hypothetical protein